MDVLTNILKTVIPSGGGFGRRNPPAQWGVTVPKGDLAIVHIVVRGQCWLSLADEEKPLNLSAGHVALLAHGDAHAVGSSPDSISDAPLRERKCSLANVGAVGTSGTTMACGFFSLHDRERHPLLSALPPLVYLNKSDAGQWLSTTIRMIAKNSGGPGGDALLDQLAGLLFIQTVRAYIESGELSGPGWLAALHDPAICPVLKHIHERPAANLTVGSLAVHAAMSRTAFAERFKAVMGEAPMTYVRRWRMHHAAHLLRTEGLSVLDICERVGYLSEATFAKAFKRALGLPPAAYRRNAIRASFDPEKARAGLLGSVIPVSSTS